jgi:PKD repeat protein
MRFWLFTTVLIFLNLHSYSQNKQAAIWHVGNKRLDFNTNPVTVTDVVTPFLGIRSSVALSGNNGSFLLFASYETSCIYNQNYLPLKNGENILFPDLRKEILFIPFPENDTLVYCIANSLYNIIDIKNDTVIAKNISWFNDDNLTLTNIYATYHANCRDFWLIYRSNLGLYSYLVTKNGIASNYSTFSPQNLPQHIGTISPSGKYYFMPRSTESGNALADFGIFNKNSGDFENREFFDLGNGIILTSAFSPDENVLYVFYKVKTNTTYYTFQFNIIDGIPDFANPTIVNTQSIPIFTAMSDMQIGIDGKIYHSFFIAAKKIDIIHSPNILGVSCNYQANAIPLTVLSSCVPNLITNWLTDMPCELDFYTENFCIPENTNFYINNITNIQSVLWNFGDSQTSTEIEPTHLYANAGTYTVTLEVTFTDNSTQSITKTIEIVDKPTNILIEHE